MRKTIYLLLAVAAVVGFSACNKSETYHEKRDREVSVINGFIAEKKINVISETTFFAQDSMTNVANNEYVLFEASGVYMQIERKGGGQKLQVGETATVLCRFTEYNLMLGSDSISLTNNFPGNAASVEKMSITNTSGTFTGTFDTSSTMFRAYGLAYGSNNVSLPSGWLVPFDYISLGRPSQSGSEVAKVRLIVPHKQGHLSASNNVIPYFYELTFERGR
ncbi:MAG: DUF4827 domain-containing protein [Prevotella sp.]|nr:DUF4827 domain-containing protein [Prevotella sp.]